MEKAGKVILAIGIGICVIYFTYIVILYHSAYLHHKGLIKKVCKERVVIDPEKGDITKF